VQPAIFLTAISLSLTSVNQNVGYIYCFGRFTKIITNALLQVCQKSLHLVIVFQEGGSPSTTLLEATVQIISDNSCSSAYIDFGGITARMICAAAPSGGRDACQVTMS
jgi:hypothetical protein